MPQDASKPTIASGNAGVSPTSLAETGKERAKQVFKLQAEFFKYLQEANKTWLARMQSEASLASQLASELAAARSIPETTTAWQHWAKRRIELFAEDSRRLLADTKTHGNRRAHAGKRSGAASIKPAGNEVS